MRVELLRDTLVRIETKGPRGFENRPSFAVEKRNFRISARSETGLLYQDRDGLAYNFARWLSVRDSIRRSV